MKITARAQTPNGLYEQNKEVLMYELKNNLCNELMKHNVFIEPPIKAIRDGYTTMEMHFFALSYLDIQKLKEFTDKYPELKTIISNIIMNK